MKKQWSIEEINLLRELYYSTAKEEILKKLNRSWKSIRCKASKLKLKRDPEDNQQDLIKD